MGWHVSRRCAASWYWSMRDSQLSNIIITKKWLQHKCFPVNFTKFLKTPFLLDTFKLVFEKLLPRWFPHIKLLTFILIIWRIIANITGKNCAFYKMQKRATYKLSKNVFGRYFHALRCYFIVKNILFRRKAKFSDKLAFLTSW